MYALIVTNHFDKTRITNAFGPYHTREEALTAYFGDSSKLRDVFVQENLHTDEQEALQIGDGFVHLVELTQ